MYHDADESVKGCRVVISSGIVYSVEEDVTTVATMLSEVVDGTEGQAR